MTHTQGAGRAGVRRWLVGLVALLLAGVSCASEAGRPPEVTTTLHVLMTDDWVTGPFVTAVRDFERAHPGVRVSVDRASIRLMPDVVRAEISTGNAPDVVQGHAFSAASQGLAEPLDDLWPGRLTADEYFPGAVQDVTWAGRIYGVPLDTNALVLIYNEDHLRQAGVPLPLPRMTFEDFRNLARALTAPDGSRRAIAMPTSTWWTYGWVAANGGELVTSPDGTPRFSLDSPEVVAAIDFLAGLVREGLAFPPRAADVGSADALALFQAGQTSLLASGSWELPKLRQAAAGRFGTTLMPRGTTGTTDGSALGGSSLWVPKGSKNRKLAFDFMVHVTGDGYALRFAAEEGRLPARPRLLADPYFGDRDLRTFLEQTGTARPETLGAFAEPTKLFARAIDEALRQGKDAAAALGEAQAAARAAPTGERVPRAPRATGGLPRPGAGSFGTPVGPGPGGRDPRSWSRSWEPS